MGRPLRIEYAGALYHITSRGNERRKIFFERKRLAEYPPLEEVVGVVTKASKINRCQSEVPGLEM